MKTDKLKITYINPLTKTVETTDYIHNQSRHSEEMEKEIHEFLESKFGEEILYKVSAAESL